MLGDGEQRPGHLEDRFLERNLKREAHWPHVLFSKDCPARTIAGLFHFGIAFRPAAVIRSQMIFMRRRPAIVL
jgi:hypothetical protein